MPKSDRHTDDPNRQREPYGDGASGDGASEELPFPDKDISPTLQRLLKRKFDEADAGGTTFITQ